jgi:ribonuclease R
MLSNKIGDELDCIVTGLAGFGVFVQSRKFGIDGLIRMADLGPDVWKFNQKTQCIVGQRCGRSIHLGQPIKVRIVSVNVPARQLNVSPAEPLAKAAVKGKKNEAGKHPKKERTRKRSKRKK